MFHVERPPASLYVCLCLRLDVPRGTCGAYRVAALLVLTLVLCLVASARSFGVWC